MSLVFAAVAPHSPILIPSVGREHLGKLEKTVASLKALEQELYARSPDAIVVISPHGPIAGDHFTLDFNDKYVCSLKEFGVFESQLTCGADMQLTNNLREHLEDRGIPIMLRSEETLDYGTIVPLTYLAAHLPKIRIIPLYPSQLPLDAHYRFGAAVQEVIMNTNLRVAVIASVDLAHRLTEDAPGGFSPRAAEFDETVMRLLSSSDGGGFVAFDQDLAKAAGECSLTTLTAFAGMMAGFHARPEILSYEGPFGIGYMVAHYTFA